MQKENGVLTGVSEEDLILLKNNPKQFWEGVVCIGFKAFFGLNLETIEIPDSVKQIERKAFGRCDFLRSVKLPKHLKKISRRTFSTCANLTFVQMPETLEEIEEEAFLYCLNLNEIDIPKTIKVIGEGAFRYCENLTKVTLPEGLEEIGVLTFNGCAMEEITIPKSVSTIKLHAFSNCENLRKVNIAPECKLLIESEAFVNCKNLQSLELPEWVILEEGCFVGSNVEELVIGNITPSALVNLKQTRIDCKRVKVREGVTDINNSLFQDLYNLQDVQLPSTLKTIGNASFAGCFGLQTINLPNGLQEIKNDAFNACELLKEVVVPDSVTAIRGGSFLGCIDLKKVNLSKNLKELGYKCFMNCYNLETIEIPNGVTTIENEMFKNCHKLTNITIPNSVKIIGVDVFNGCTDLKTINLPNGVTSLGMDCFYKSGLTKIKLPDSIKKLGYGCFRMSADLQEIELSKNLQEISREAFKRCTSLKTIEIPDSVEKICSFSFFGCENLEKVVIKRNKKLENDIFQESGIKFVTITKDEYIFSRTPERVAGAITIPYKFYELLHTYSLFDKFVENCEVKTFNSEMTPWQKLLEQASENNLLTLYRFAYDLGCFSKEKLRDKSGVELEATKGQKRSSLLAAMFSSGALNLQEITTMFAGMRLMDLTDNAVKFLANTNKKEFVNINLLKQLEQNYPGITIKVLRDFETAKQGRITINTQTRMPQTLSWEQALIKFYEDRLYEGIDDENRDLAVIFKKKNVEQLEFDEADQIRRKAKKAGMPSHILGKELKEESLLETIERTKKQTSTILGDAKQLIEELYAKKFTYEMLDKYDPHNAILGLFANCCATITSEAYGGDIARATMRASDVQNLVVRDINGEIIAKGTLYVNHKFGYVVINDFEINEQFKKDKTEVAGRYSSSPDSPMEKDRELIFRALMRGINSFVQEYDKQNPSNPIKQVNVGMGYNRLKAQCERYEKATEMLAVPEEYSFEDAKKEQYILYKRESNKEEEVIR